MLKVFFLLSWNLLGLSSAFTLSNYNLRKQSFYPVMDSVWCKSGALWNGTSETSAVYTTLAGLVKMLALIREV